MGTDRWAGDGQLQRGEPRGKACRALALQGLAAREITLLGIIDAGEFIKTGLKRCPLAGEIGTIERITHLEPEGVAGTESARLHSGGKQALPESDPLGHGNKELEAILTGVSGPRDQ